MDFVAGLQPELAIITNESNPADLNKIKKKRKQKKTTLYYPIILLIMIWESDSFKKPFLSKKKINKNNFL